MNFAWDSPQTQTTDLTETQKPGYTLTSATCLLNGNATGSAITNGVHLSVGPRDTVQCTFNNRTLRAGSTWRSGVPNGDDRQRVRHLHLRRHQRR